MKRLLAGLTLALLLSPPARAQATGSIEGTITDSVHARPLAGASVRATRLGVEPETTLAASTDARGRFRFDRLAEGRYAVGFLSDLLDSLEYGAPVPHVSVVAGRTAHVDLAVPSGAALRAAACPGVKFPARTGALLGHVTDASTERPLAAARLLVAWTELTIDSANHVPTAEDRLTRATADADGQFRLCGVPTGEWLVVQVQLANRAGSILRVSIDDAVGVLVRNLSFSMEGSRPLAQVAERAPDDTSPLPPLTGTASVTGTVRSAGGQPVSDAQVSLLNAGLPSRTDARGEFVLLGLPAGTHDVEVRKLGYRVDRRSVDLRGGQPVRIEVQLERAVVLDSIAVVARRVRYPEFESRRKWATDGKFLGEDELERHHVQTVSEIVATIPAFNVVGAGVDARVLSSRGGCPAVIVVDHVRVQSINEVQPSLVGAMEFYPGASGAPMQYRSPCGTIVIWTKR